MILHQAQKIVAKDNHRFRVVNCGRRFGKTSLAAVEMIGYAIAYDKARISYYAPTRDDARDIMWNILCREAEEIIVNKNESRLELEVKNKFGNTSLIVLYGWEAVQERKKGIGVMNKFIVLDEVSKYRNFWEGWQEVLRPTLTDLRGHAMFISTPNGFNHFYDLYNFELKDNDYKSFHFTSYDNPFLPKDEIDKAKQEITEDRFAQEYMADFRKQEGLVYKEFSRERHIYEKDPEGIVETIAGIDFGFTNPCAVLKVLKDKDNGYWVAHEWYKTGKTDAEVADYVKMMVWDAVYPDPESPAAITELQRRYLPLREVVKGKDSIKNGINKVRDLFKKNKLHIHKDCINLIWELESYAYDTDNPEKETPIKENDHALDALRYIIGNDLPVEQHYFPDPEDEYVPTNPYEGKL